MIIFSQTFFVILQSVFFTMQYYLSEIRRPIEAEMSRFNALYDESMSHADDGMLNNALGYIRQRSGKRMRPMLTILMAKNFGMVSDKTYLTAVGLELLHTASLVHDDVVDEADCRRGQSSINNVYGNKSAVLIGDYILSTALLNVAKTGCTKIMECLSELGRTLANGEIMQLTANGSEDISEEAYYSIIEQKTAALFEACCEMGAMSVNAAAEDIEEAKKFGRILGTIFQIRDDIFDYYELSQLGKPTGNDMAEGKLTLPAIHILLTTDNAEMFAIAQRVKALEATKEEIAKLIDFTKKNGGVEYAENVMYRLHDEARKFIDSRVGNESIKLSLTAYLDYSIKRTL